VRKMRKREPNWVKNKYGDDKPKCSYCEEPYGDGDIFEIKNYPHDGHACIFFPCETCKEEARLIVPWVKIKEGKYVVEL